MVIYFFTDFWICGTYMSIQRHQSTFKHLLLLKKKRNILPYFVFLCQGWGLRLLSAVLGLAAHLCYALPQAGQPITEALGAHFHTSLHPAASWASVVSSSASQLISDFYIVTVKTLISKGRRKILCERLCLFTFCYTRLNSTNVSEIKPGLSLCRVNNSMWTHLL